MDRLLHVRLWWFILWLLPLSGQAQEPPSVMTLSPADPQFREGIYDIDDYLYIFFDSTETRVIEEVGAPAFQSHFFKDSLRIAYRPPVDMGPDIRYIWARLTLYSDFDHDQEWLINISAAEVDLFVPTGTDSAGFDHYRSGTILPLPDRALKDSYGILFNVNDEA